MHGSPTGSTGTMRAAWRPSSSSPRWTSGRRSPGSGTPCAIHQDELNRLNVYPVPDGDTGTNMTLTLESVVHELGSAEDMAGGLPGGRPRLADGGPGQLRRDPLARSCGGSPTRSGPSRPSAARGARGSGCGKASDAAYEAVMRPVEGTILTVVRGAAEAAEARA